MKWVRRFILLAVAAGVVAAIVLALQPRPVLVDTATIERGPMMVAISDDGRTRIRERYVVSAPLSGRLVRIALDPGDPVVARETLLTTIEPTDPELLDPRAVALAKARVKAAEARVQLAQPRLESARESLNLEESQLGRVQQLMERNAVSQEELNRQQVAFRKAGNDFSAASFELQIAEFELQQAQAALLHTTADEQTPTDAAAPSDVDWGLSIRSPVSGRVLRVFQESATVIQAGSSIMELGDPEDLEIEVDVLSTDAVRIVPGARVFLKEWGGGKTLEGRVRLIEPSAFTKVSALGIEEQRVDVIVDFTSPVQDRSALGDGFRVEADIVLWESDDVLKVPAGALFREAGEWAVFVVRDNTATLQQLVLGHRNDDAAEVLEGLQPGELVVLYPGDRVASGTPVRQRVP